MIQKIKKTEFTRWDLMIAVLIITTILFQIAK